MKKELDNTFVELPKAFSTMIGRVVVEGVEYPNIMEWYNSLEKKEGNYTILLNSKSVTRKKVVVKEAALSDSPFFKFNRIYNDNKPIPLAEMWGIIVDERSNMVKMDLWDKDYKIHWIGWLLKSWIVEGYNEIN